jgi:hypothetical protein
MGLKEDAKFARFITMGALGAHRVAEDLKPRGHQIIELERYAMANKIWSTKIKRLRMADLVCVACGRRFEAKAKSKPEVKLSDSRQAGRRWSDGMRDDDIFAFLAITLDEDNQPLAIGKPLYFTTRSMRSVPPRQGQLKSAADGSERDVYWPVTLAKREGIVTRVLSGRITVESPGARASTLGRSGDMPLVGAGEHVTAGMVIGSAVPPATHLDCPGASWDLARALDSDDETEAFAAVKAIGALKVSELAEPVRAIADDPARDMRLRIEALGALALLGDREAVSRLAQVPASDTAMHMECVLILSELVGIRAAAQALRDIASSSANADEIRAAAAWGLGAPWHDRFGYLWPLAFDESEKVRRHAQASIGVPGSSDIPELIAALKDEERAPFAAAILARSGAVEELVESLKDASIAPWALQALGQIPPVEADDMFNHISGTQQSVLEALWRRNLRDTHNEPANLTELKFLAGQSLGVQRAESQSSEG